MPTTRYVSRSLSDVVKPIPVWCATVPRHTSSVVETKLYQVANLPSIGASTSPYTNYYFFGS